MTELVKALSLVKSRSKPTIHDQCLMVNVGSNLISSIVFNMLRATKSKSRSNY